MWHTERVCVCACVSVLAVGQSNNHYVHKIIKLSGLEWTGSLWIWVTSEIMSPPAPAQAFWFFWRFFSISSIQFHLRTGAFQRGPLSNTKIPSWVFVFKSGVRPRHAGFPPHQDSSDGVTRGIDRKMTRAGSDLAISSWFSTSFRSFISLLQVWKWTAEMKTSCKVKKNTVWSDPDAKHLLSIRSQLAGVCLRRLNIQEKRCVSIVFPQNHFIFPLKFSECCGF